MYVFTVIGCIVVMIAIIVCIGTIVDDAIAILKCIVDIVGNRVSKANRIN